MTEVRTFPISAGYVIVEGKVHVVPEGWRAYVVMEELDQPVDPREKGKPGWLNRDRED